MNEPYEVSADLSAQNTFSDWMQFRGGGEKSFAVEATGTFDGTLTVQVRRANGSAIDLEDHTAPFAKTGEWVGSFDVRVGFKTGNYTSGTASVQVRK